MRYTSDMTDSQWEIIKPILQGAKYRSLEEKREQINAVFYLVLFVLHGDFCNALQCFIGQKCLIRSQQYIWHRQQQ